MKDKEIVEVKREPEQQDPLKHLVEDIKMPVELIAACIKKGYSLDDLTAAAKPNSDGRYWWQTDNEEFVAAHLEWTTKKIDGVKTEVVANTGMNFLNILRYDDHFSNIKFNLLRGVPEKVQNGKNKLWVDADDAEARIYIEKIYQISNPKKYEDAFTTFQYERSYDPITERIDAIKWDGKPRVKEFLCKWLWADNTPYTQECSRLLFAGGINRAYNPGSKFDNVVVLIGKQGGGKSTICQWLALAPELYSSVKTISGQKGQEAIQGKWVCEIEELLATLANEHSGERAEENAKAFLSTASDFYRKPYDHRPQDNPRHCIFIGTTNRDMFLTDKTGNRRWYPVTVKSDGHYLYEHEAECKADICQCWAEMREAYKNGEALARTVPCEDMAAAILEQQQEAEQEDWRIGVIEEYCKNRTSICLLELWRNALYENQSPHYPEMKRKDSNELAEIMVHKLGWIRGEKPEYFGDLGRQRSYHNPNQQMPELKEL